MSAPVIAEPWLRGPVEGVPPLLQPAAHALILAVEEIESAIGGLSPTALTLEPHGAASVSFHIRHAAGSLDRLYTYARGEMLSEPQREALVAERQPSALADADAHLSMLRAQVDRALAQLRATSESSLGDRREVGRKRLPSTVLGLLFHGAEHTARHTGQVVTTARIAAAMEARQTD
ncbi:MAG TPA: DinB family protein [Gemmatimonadaceae bacterium]|nr:DinB family protein [Gemmatimonadaceae bacterium]